MPHHPEDGIDWNRIDPHPKERKMTLREDQEALRNQETFYPAQSQPLYLIAVMDPKAENNSIFSTPEAARNRAAKLAAELSTQFGVRIHVFEARELGHMEVVEPIWHAAP